ncbi:MAG: MlaD family protein [Bacteroidetes bacterium]|nr:MlaD family protein [Bacteroidota bacterium]
MEKSSAYKLKLGIFVTVIIAVLIVGIYFIGDRKQLFNNTFRVSGIFKDINGLQVGNNVRFSGINVGIIEDIEQISDSTVQVSMLIDEDSRKFMKKNAKAIIGSDGLMGSKILIITAGKVGEKSLENNDFIETRQPINMDEIFAKLKITGDNAASITGDLAAIMENIRSGKGTIGKLFMDTTFAENLDKTLINIKQGSKGFKKNMDAASQNVFLKGFMNKKDEKKEKK